MTTGERQILADELVAMAVAFNTLPPILTASMIQRQQ